MKPQRRTDWNRIRKLALGLGLPGVDETSTWGQPSLTVFLGTALICAVLAIMTLTSWPAAGGIWLLLGYSRPDENRLLLGHRAG
jgi:hypothetical protein